MAYSSQLSPTMLIVLVAVGSMTGGGIGNQVGPENQSHVELKSEIAEIRSAIRSCKLDVEKIDRIKENDYVNQIYRYEKDEKH